jgi:hypothetical protein
MSKWYVEPAHALRFPDLLQTCAVSGRQINASTMSRLVKTDLESPGYYVKIYMRRGNKLRRYAGRSRVRAEWENLKLFKKLGIPTLDLVAYGESTTADGYQGALVTRELCNTRDLAGLAEEQHPLMEDTTWRRGVIRQLAEYVRKMHDARFIHNDLKWRNILVKVDAEPSVYIIDCPLGRRMYGLFLSRFVKKDLACLDKIGRRVLSRTDRLRFYLAYTGQRKLNAGDRKVIRRTLQFFSGRD